MQFWHCWYSYRKWTGEPSLATGSSSSALRGGEQLNTWEQAALLASQTAAAPLTGKGEQKEILPVLQRISSGANQLQIGDEKQLLSIVTKKST